jgi:hypothetical protein
MNAAAVPAAAQSEYKAPPKSNCSDQARLLLLCK